MLIKIFSNEIITIDRKKRKFTPSEKTCTVEIFPIGETEKSYILDDGANGYIGHGRAKQYYKHIAKSICYIDKNGRIFAPSWA